MNQYDNHKMSIIDELRQRDINVSIISFFLDVSELRIWKWEKKISKIPEKHKRKLEVLLKRIKKNPFS